MVERVAQICAAHDEERPLRIALLDELQHLVGFDAYAWLLTDPETEVGCAPLADVPGLPLLRLPELIRLKYLTSVNRWTGLGAGAVTLQSATRGEPSWSLAWRELLVEYGVTDVASLVFRDRFGCWGWLDLWRTGPGRHFTEAETTLLAALTSPICDALRRCQAGTFKLDGSEGAQAGPVVLVLSPELTVRAQTAETEEYLRMLVPPDADRPPVPAGAYNVAAQLLAVEAGIDPHLPSARVHLTGGLWLTLRAARISGPPPQEQSDIAVTIERASSTQRLDLFVRAHGLSEREAELVRHLAAGSDTRRLAQQMYVSSHTVQDHLKSIFAKTGARNRRTLLARIAGP